MADDEVSVKVEVIADDAVKDAKRVKSATDSMVESMERARRMGETGSIPALPSSTPLRDERGRFLPAGSTGAPSTPKLAPGQLPPPARGTGKLPPVPTLPERSASEQLRAASADIASGATSAHARVIADMQRRAEMKERLEKQARRLGLSERLASEYVEAASKRATSSIGGRIRALRGEFSALGRGFGEVGREVRSSAAAIGGELRGLGSEVGNLLAPAIAPVRRGLASIASYASVALSPITTRVRAVANATGRAFSRMTTSVRSGVGRASRAIGRLLSPITSRVNAVASAVRSRARSMASSIGSALAPIGKRFGSLGATIGRSLGNVGGKLRGVVSAIGPQLASAASMGAAAIASVGVAVAAVAATITGVLTAALVKFGHAAAQAGIEAQASLYSIQRLLEGDHGGGAAAQFDEVRRMAQDLGLDVHQTTDSFQALLRMKFDPAIAKDIIKMGADLQSVGVHAEEVQGVITAMSQIKAKGRLQSEELLQLQERGVSGELVQGAIMRRMGLTDKQEYQRLLEGGKISSGVALASIRDAIMAKTNESQLGEAGGEFANNTLRGQLNQLKAGWQNLKLDAGMAMLPGLKRTMGAAREIIVDLQNSPAVQHLGDSLLAGFDRLSSWMARNGPKLTPALEKSIEGLATAVDVAIVAFDWLAEHGEIVRGVLAVLAVIMGVLAFATMLALLPLVALVAGIVAIVIAIGWLVSAIPGAIDALGEWASSAYEWGENIVTGLVDGMRAGVQDVRDAAGSVWDAIESTFTGPSKADIHSPSRKTWRWGGHINAGVAGGIMGSLSMVRGASAALADAALPSSAPSNDNSPRVKVVRGRVGGGDDAGNRGRGDSDNSGGGSGPVVHLHLTVEAPPGGTREDGERYGEGVASGMERGFMQLLSGAALTGS